MSAKGENNKKTKGNLRSMVDRRTRATERLATKRSDVDQLAWLDNKGYRALRERAKLLKRLEQKPQPS